MLSRVYQSSKGMERYILGWPVSSPLALTPKPQFLISNAGPGTSNLGWAPTPKHLQSTVSVPAHWPRPGRSGGISRATTPAALFRVQCHWQSGSLGAVTPGHWLLWQLERQALESWNKVHARGLDPRHRLIRITGRTKQTNKQARAQSRGPRERGSQKRS